MFDYESYKTILNPQNKSAPEYHIHLTLKVKWCLPLTVAMLTLH